MIGAVVFVIVFVLFLLISLGIRRRQLEYPLQRKPGSLCGTAGRDRPERVGQEREVRRSRIHGDATSVSFRSQPSNPVRLFAKTYVVAESD